MTTSTPASTAAAASAGDSHRWNTFVPRRARARPTGPARPSRSRARRCPCSRIASHRLERLDLEDHVDADRAVGERADRPHPLDDLLRRVARGAGHPEAAGVRDRRGELGGGDGPGARADDRQLDPEQVAEASPERHARVSVRRHELPHHPRRRAPPRERPRVGAGRRSCSCTAGRCRTASSTTRSSGSRAITASSHSTSAAWASRTSRTAATTSTSWPATSASCSGARARGRHARRLVDGLHRFARATSSGGGERVSKLVLVNGPIRLARTDDDSFPWSMTRGGARGLLLGDRARLADQGARVHRGVAPRARPGPRRRDLRDHAADAARRRAQGRARAGEARLPRLPAPARAAGAGAVRPARPLLPGRARRRGSPSSAPAASTSSSRTAPTSRSSRRRTASPR